MPRYLDARVMLDQDLKHLRHQRTIAAPITFLGIGLHTGERTTMRLRPAESGHGVAIIRKDLAIYQQAFALRCEAVIDSGVCTTVGNLFGHQVSTVEHLLSALAGLGIDNVIIELNGPEIPIMDGSAMPFVEALEKVGMRRLDARREVIVVRRPVHLQQGSSWAELLPDPSRRVTVSIDFEARVIGTQTLSIDVTPEIYRREIAPARTFGFADRLEQLRRRGLLQGGSIKNVILVREGKMASLEGLRFRDEFVRHKVLDVIGDLALAGAPIIGHYRGNRPGPQLNTNLAALLMEDEDAWVRLPIDELGDVFEEDRDIRHTGELGEIVGSNEDGGENSRRLPANRIRQLFGSDRWD